jgi:hypothetical protein
MDFKKLYNAMAHPSFHPTPVSRWVVAFKNGYKLDRRLFLTYLAFVLVTAVIASSQTGFVWKQAYFSCDTGNGAPCFNELYGTCDEWYCQQETWPDGYEYGNKPTYLYNNFGAIAIGALGLVVLLNHLLLNRKWEPGELQ